jgi:hypothetical protein
MLSGKPAIDGKLDLQEICRKKLLAMSRWPLAKGHQPMANG